MTVRPLMHGSTSPLKNGCPACSQRQWSLTSATARRTGRQRGSTPKSCSSWSVGSVEVHGWPWFSSRRQPSAGKHAPPAHWPSSPCNASSLAPQPSVATRARSAATTSAGAWTRSRNTCQRMAGSESSSQSSTVMQLRVETAGSRAHSGREEPGYKHGPPGGADCGGPDAARGRRVQVTLLHASPVHGRTVTAASNVNCSRVSAGSVKCSVP